MTLFATPKLVVGIALTMGGLFSTDQFLAGLEHRELDAQARHEYERGVAFLRNGHNSEAIGAFRSARSADRDNLSFELALADALIRDHQPHRAVDTLSEILDKDSNNGQANLLMARAMDEDQKYAGANSYYHRAIYGTWPPNLVSQQIDARIELVHWLAQRGDQKGLLSELISMEPLAVTDSRIARELPALYRQAGAASRAIDSYRNLLHDNPADADAYAGLGEAEIESGNFRASRQAFERATELRPGDTSLKQRAELALNALGLDPTPRWLSSRDKLERSTRILQLTIAAIAPCAGAQPEDSQLLEKARQLSEEKKPAATNEAAETRLDYAQTIWNTRDVRCDRSPGQDDLLAALMRKLGQ